MLRRRGMQRALIASRTAVRRSMIATSTTTTTTKRSSNREDRCRLVLPLR